jgi:4,5-dihydroxyphthalate decarboxylase
MALDLTLSLIAGPRTTPVISGEVPIANVTAQAKAAQSVNTNSLEMLDLKYDVAEMSLATFTHAREQGRPLVALPIFPGRRFMQNGVVFAPNSGIKNPSELRGKRVGLPQFWMTSSVWHRLTLNREYGVAQKDVRWVTMAPERLGTLRLPPEAKQDTSGRNVRELMQAGELDANMGAGGGEGRGDGGAARDGGPRPIPAFPEPAKSARAYFEKTGIFPIVHLIVMKQELADKEPWLVESLCNAFVEAKQRTLPDALETDAELPIPGLGADPTVSLFGDDPWPYGISKNRVVLEAFLEDVHQQGLIARAMTPEDLFVSNAPSELR